MRAPARVAVVGCGTSGPAVAVLLRRQGHEVTVFERAPQCRAVGAGFLLQPSGMAVLRELGILESVIERAARITRLHVVKPNQRTLLDLHYDDLAEGCFGAGLHRPVLLDHMIRLMVNEGVRIAWDHEIVGARRSEGRWILCNTHGEEVNGFDLLIVADGARSKLRELAGTGGINRGYPWGAHWFIGRNDGAFPENELYQVVEGTQKLCGFLATGCGTEGEDRLVSLFWSVRVDEDEALRSQPLDRWKKQILDVCPRAEGLLGQIESWEHVLLARYGDVRMRRWYGDGVVVIGDAGHAMSPQLGQGVNLALQDASCLARCLREMSIQEALRQYQRERLLNLRYYQLATRWLTPWFQSDYEWLAPLRDVFFCVSGNVPPFRNFMTRTMAGMVGAGGVGTR